MQKILTPSGYKDLSLISVGDTVVGSDGFNTVLEIDLWDDSNYDVDNHGDFVTYLINGKYKLYKNQSIFANGVLVHASMLNVGDLLETDTGDDEVITSIEQIEYNEWYRLSISGNHIYYVDGLLLHNASRYWVGGGSSANWNATSNTNWGSSSGTQDNASVPGSSDAVTFDGAGSGGNSNSTVSAIITILSLTFTSGYTQTITKNAVVTIAGNFTDNTAHSWAGTGAIGISAASTITSGGKAFNSNVTFSGNNDKTIADAWTIDGTLTISGTTTITINGLLTINTSLSISSTILTFSGNYGFYINTFNCSNSSATTITFVHGVAYTINSSLSSFNSRTGSILLFTSDHATNKAILTLTNGATCNVLANFTRIDASGGRSINTFNGTVTNCNNINSFSDLKTVGFGC